MTCATRDALLQSFQGKRPGRGVPLPWDLGKSRGGEVGHPLGDHDLPQDTLKNFRFVEDPIGEGD